MNMGTLAYTRGGNQWTLTKGTIVARMTWTVKQQWYVQASQDGGKTWETIARHVPSQSEATMWMIEKVQDWIS